MATLFAVEAKVASLCRKKADAELALSLGSGVVSLAFTAVATT